MLNRSNASTKGKTMKLPKRRFQQEIKQRFIKDEIRAICYDLSINPEELDDKTINTLTESLLIFVEKQGRIMDLVNILRAEQSEIDWLALAFADVGCPYRGLLPFREDDAHLFYGRDAYIERLLEAVEKRPLVAVIGSSGSGKSSVVFAGLIPRLRPTDQQPISQWQIIDFAPGKSPFENLSGELIPLLEPDLSESAQLVEANTLNENLVKGKISLHQVMARIASKLDDRKRILLIVDQFEELYTQTEDTTVQEAFTKALLSLRQVEAVTVLLTMRADFLDRALAYRPFADELQVATQMIGPMDRDELIEVIERPLSGTFVTFEPGLTTQILDDVGKEPGNLPLLEFALESLWQEQADGKLTFAVYEKIGKVEGALTKQADAAFNTYEEKDEDILVRRLFVQLVQPVNTSVNTKRKAWRSELGDELWRLAAELADARLIVTNQDDKSGEDYIELAHEALITNWERFDGWIKEDWEFRAWQERLRISLRQWESHEEDSGFLLFGAPLAVAEEWLGKKQHELNHRETAFIRASIDAEKKRQAEEKARQERELAQARELATEQQQRAEEQKQAATNLRRRLIYVVGFAVLAAFLGVAAVFFGVSSAENAAVAESNLVTATIAQGEAQEQAAAAQIAEAAAIRAEGTAEFNESLANTREAEAIEQQLIAQTEREIAQEQRDIAIAQSFVNASKIEGTNNVMRSLLMVIEGDKLYSTAASFDALQEIYQYAGEPIYTFFDDHPITSIQLNNSQSIALATSNDGTVTAWDIDNEEKMFVLSHEGEVELVEWNPGESRILTLSQKNTGETTYRVVAKLWDATSGNLISELNTDLGYPLNWEFTTGSYGAKWSQFGDAIVTYDPQGVIKIWDAETGHMRKEISHDNEGDSLQGIMFSTNNLLYSIGEISIKIWNIHSDTAIKEIVQTGPIEHYKLSNDGSQLIILSHSKSGSDDSPEEIPPMLTISVWEASTGDLIETLDTSTDALIYNAIWNPDESKVLLHGYDYAALIDRSTGEIITKVENINQFLGVKLSSDEKRILTYHRDQLVRVWDVETGELVFWFEPEGEIFFAESNRLGTRILTLNSEQTFGGRTVAQLWDGNTGLLLKTLPHNGDIVHGFWNEDQIVTSSRDGTVKLWDDRGDLLLSFTQNGPVTDVAWSRDQTQLFVASEDGAVTVWNTNSAPLFGSKPLFNLSVPNVDNSRYIKRDFPGFTLYDAETDEELAYLIHSEQMFDGETIYLQAYMFAWHPSGEYVLTTGNDGLVNIWNANDGELLTSLDHSSGNDQLSAKWNSNGNQIISYGEGTTKLWMVHSDDSPLWSELLTSLPGGGPFGHSASQVSWNSDESYILAKDAIDNSPGALGNEAQLWEGLNLSYTMTHGSNINTILWHPDGDRFLTGATDGSIKLWSVEEESPVLEFYHVDDEVDGLFGEYDLAWVKWQPEGTYFLSFGGKLMYLWNSNSEQPINIFDHKEQISDAWWNHDGDRILTIGINNAKLWNLDSDTPLFTFSHDQQINGIVWGSDGKHIITYSDDGTAKVWNVENGSLLYTLSGGGRISYVEWKEAEGQILVYTENNDTYFNSFQRVSIFSTDKDYRVTLACSRTTRNLTWNEWTLLAPEIPYELTCPEQNHPVDCSVPVAFRPEEYIHQWNEQCNTGN